MLTLTTCARGKVDAGSTKYRIRIVAAAMHANLLVSLLFDYAAAALTGRRFQHFASRWDAVAAELHEEFTILSEVNVISGRRDDCDACCIPEAVKILARAGGLDHLVGFLEKTRLESSAQALARIDCNFGAVFTNAAAAFGVAFPERDMSAVTRAGQVLSRIHALQECRWRLEEWLPMTNGIGERPDDGGEIGELLDSLKKRIKSKHGRKFKFLE